MEVHMHEDSFIESNLVVKFGGMYSVNEVYDTGAVPAFLKKLWTLVEDPSTDELICWGHSGASFHVYDQARFAREVLPLYFKHSNIASFIRQLNMYGFRKVMNVETGGLKVEKDDLEFHHPYFHQGHEELMENIKRKVSPGMKVDSVRLKQEDVSKVLADVRNLRGKQEAITTKMDVLKRENEALWREVASLRQKHLKQQQIVNKLIQFLVTLVRSNREIPTNSRKRVMPLMLNDSRQIAAKQPKLSRQLSIEEKSKSYKVESPPASDVTFSQPQTSGPIIHEVIDTVPTIDPETEDTEEVSPIDLLSETNPSTYKAPPTVKITATSSATTNTGTLNKAVTKTAPLPTTSTFVSPCDRRDVSEQLDVLQTDIDELKDLLSGGQYNMDPTMLLGLFNPETPLSQMTETVSIPNTSSQGNEIDNPGTILGNELIQYEPQDDLSSMPLFDLGDTSLPLAGLEDNGLDSDEFNQLQESQEPQPFAEPDILLTPQVTPGPDLMTTIKSEKQN